MRRVDVVGIGLYKAAMVTLARVALIQQHNEWQFRFTHVGAIIEFTIPTNAPDRLQILRRVA